MTDSENLWQSLVNNSSIATTMIWNIIILGQTQREINSYSSKLTHSEDDISATTLQLILQKTMQIKTLKRTCI